MKRRGWRRWVTEQSIDAALRDAAARIGGETPRLDAEVLLAHALGRDRGWILLNRDAKIDAQAYEKLVLRRIAGEPVAYITGVREFWSLRLKVTPAVLIPRPDSETLIEAALASGVQPTRILDLGTGSGALLLAALTEWRGATGLGVDQSLAALAIAAENAALLGLGHRASFQQGDWGQGLAERFDLILCNPPYVETDAPLSGDVRDHEPASALFAGPDGLDEYRRLIPQLPALLAPDGVAVVEIGHTQAAAVAALAAAAGLDCVVKQDLAGRDRCLVLRRE